REGSPSGEPSFLYRVLRFPAACQMRAAGDGLGGKAEVTGAVPSCVTTTLSNDTGSFAWKAMAPEFKVVSVACRTRLELTLTESTPWYTEASSVYQPPPANA